MSRAKSVFTKTGSKHLDAIVIKRSMLVKPTKRKYQKEVLQRLDHKRSEECHQRCGKRNNQKWLVKKQLEKISTSLNLNKSHTEKFFYLRKKIISEELFKISKDQRLQYFRKLTRKVVLEKTSKAEGFLEAQQCHKLFPLPILAKINFQYNHYRTRYLQSL